MRRESIPPESMSVIGLRSPRPDAITSSSVEPHSSTKSSQPLAHRVSVGWIDHRRVTRRDPGAYHATVSGGWTRMLWYSV